MEIVLHSIVDWVMLWISYSMGTAAGSLTGSLAGVLLAYQYGGLEPIGMYALLGMLMGGYRKIGKLGQCILSYGTMVMLDYFFSGLQFHYHIDESFFVAVILFLLMPIKKDTLFQKQKQEDRAMIYQVMNVALRNRLRDYAGSFGRLAVILDSEDQSRVAYTSLDSKSLVEEIAGQMCATCSRRSYCIDRNYIATFQSTHEIVCALEEGKGITIEDIPMDFSNRCIRLGEFLMTADRRVELARVNMAWSNRLKEGRQVMAKQFFEAAEVMESFSTDVGKEQPESVEREKYIKGRMSLSGITIKKLLPMKEGNEVLYYVVAKYNRGKVLTSREVAKSLGRAMKEPLSPTEACPRLLNQQYQVMTFCKANRFFVNYGVCHFAKAEEAISGDNYSVVQRENRVTLVLADGMGSGQAAYNESCMIVEMMEQFLEAGLPVRESIRLMNGALSLHVEKDVYSTLDVFSLDLREGAAEIIKFGAAASFIKRGDSVEVVTDSSLPIGVVQMADSYIIEKKIFGDDMIIMMSDGVLEALPVAEKEEAMIELLKGMKETNPQKAAELIMNKVQEQSGAPGKDDNTVLVLSVSAS